MPRTHLRAHFITFDDDNEWSNLGDFSRLHSICYIEAHIFLLKNFVIKLIGFILIFHRHVQ